MKKKLLSIGILSLFALTNCTTSEQQTFNLDSELISLQSKKQENIENKVSKERMISNLGIFSGVSSFGDNQKITERGSKKGRELTKVFLKSALKDLGYSTEEVPYSGFYSGSNIVTTLKATEPTNEYIIVGAHMDSVSNPGADDNASGSTAVLEAATILKDMPVRKLNIIFAWFDQEELGLIGSKELAKAYKSKNMNINSVHIVDMLGWDGDGDRTVEVARPGGFLWDYYQMVNKKHNLNVPLFRTSLDRSDHYSFETKGYNALLLTEEYVNQDFNEHYHKQTDTHNRINFDFLTLGTKLMVAAVSDLTMKVPAPINIKFVPHDKFPTREGFCHGGPNHLHE